MLTIAVIYKPIQNNAIDMTDAFTIPLSPFTKIQTLRTHLWRAILPEAKLWNNVLILKMKTRRICLARPSIVKMLAPRAWKTETNTEFRKIISEKLLNTTHRWNCGLFSQGDIYFLCFPPFRRLWGRGGGAVLWLQEVRWVLRNVTQVELSPQFATLQTFHLTWQRIYFWQRRLYFWGWWFLIFITTQSILCAPNTGALVSAQEHARGEKNTFEAKNNRFKSKSMVRKAGKLIVPECNANRWLLMLALPLESLLRIQIGVNYEGVSMEAFGCILWGKITLYTIVLY